MGLIGQALCAAGTFNAWYNNQMFQKCKGFMSAGKRYLNYCLIQAATGLFNSVLFDRDGGNRQENRERASHRGAHNWIFKMHLSPSGMTDPGDTTICCHHRINGG